MSLEAQTPRERLVLKIKASVVILGMTALIPNAALADNNCASVLALSRNKQSTIQSESEIQAAASNFCSAYSSYKSTGKTDSFGASYEMLAASFSTSSVSYDQVASTYCSASSNFSKYNGNYQSYVDSIAPGAMAAYEKCIEGGNSGIHFEIDTASVLPKEFIMFVKFDKPGVQTVKISVTASSGVTCGWGNSSNTEQSLTSPSSASLRCQRKDSGYPSFVGLSSDQSVDVFTVPWQAYSQDGIPTNTIASLQNSINLGLQNAKADFTKSLATIMGESNVQICPWGTDYQINCTAKCSIGIAIGGECQVGNTYGNSLAIFDFYKNGPNWTCHYADTRNFGLNTSHSGVNVTAKATCFVAAQ